MDYLDFAWEQRKARVIDEAFGTKGMDLTLEIAFKEGYKYAMRRSNRLLEFVNELKEELEKYQEEVE